ncbi:MAG: hypothetical protein ACXVCY_16255 [Pseudobdellovibrionaceae bacterium]
MKRLTNLYTQYKLAFTLILSVSVFYSSLSLAVDSNELIDSFSKGEKNPSYVLSTQELSEIGQNIQKEIDLRNENDSEYQDYSDQILTEIKRLFIDGRLQEGIWFLDRLGYYSESEYLSQVLTNHLELGVLKKGEPIGTGGSKPYWGVSDSLPVVIKSEEWEGSTDAEFLAFHLDRMLGLNIVPSTVNAYLEDKIRSVQIALQDMTDSNISFEKNGYSPKYPEIFILDFLLGHVDRIGMNSLISPLGFLAAIDNARLAILPHPRPGARYWARIWDRYPHGYPFKNLPSPSIVNTIVNLNIDDFKKEFSKFASTKMVNDVSRNLEKIQASLPKPTTPGKGRPINPEERLRFKRQYSNNLTSQETDKSFQKLLQGSTHSINCNELFVK